MPGSFLSPREAIDHLEAWLSGRRAPDASGGAKRIARDCERLGAVVLPPEACPIPLVSSAPWRAPLLFARGDVSLLRSPCHAIVGSRKPSAFAMRAALELGAAAADRGLCVVSGLARGVDGAAHRAALGARGKTVAVLAHGLDVVYPPEHRSLAEAIARDGCLVTSFPPGTAPLKPHFPERNHLIASLASATTVIEAGFRSGSLITAHAAVDAGREVLVVVGPYGDERYAGSHDLLRQGAVPVGSLRDWIEIVFPETRWPSADSQGESQVIKALGGIVSVDSLRRVCPTRVVELLGLVGKGVAEGWMVELLPQTWALVEKVPRGIREGR